MNKLGQIIFSPKVVSFTLGGAAIGYFIFQTIESTILGAIIGLGLSLIR